VHTSYGWIECAGLADRSAFDLTQHQHASKVDLMAYEQFDKPQTVEVVEVVPQMKVLGKELKKEGKAVAEHLTALGEDDALALKARALFTLGIVGRRPLKAVWHAARQTVLFDLRRVHQLAITATQVQAKLEEGGSAEVTVDGKAHALRADMVTIDKVTKMLSGRNYTPSVIEPSFGIGRVLYCVFEHTFYAREDKQRTVFRFSPIVAPMKTTVFPLLQRKELNDVASTISLDLRRAGISSIIDTTGAPLRLVCPGVVCANTSCCCI
jgi:glycyl-tRNA synthetase